MISDAALSTRVGDFKKVYEDLKKDEGRGVGWFAKLTPLSSLHILGPIAATVLTFGVMSKAIKAINTESIIVRFGEYFTGFFSDMWGKFAEVFSAWPAPDKPSDSAGGEVVDYPLDVTIGNVPTTSTTSNPSTKSVTDTANVPSSRVPQTKRTASATKEQRQEQRQGRGSLSDFVSLHESGGASYDAYNRGTASALSSKQPLPISTYTVGQIRKLQALPKADPTRLFAVGKYQIIGTTLTGAVKAGIVGDEEVFSQLVQERIFTRFLVNKARPAIARYITGGGSLPDAQQALAQEFASMATSSGRGAYDGVAGNRAHTTSEQVQTVLMTARKRYSYFTSKGLPPSEAYDAAIGSPILTPHSTDSYGYTPAPAPAKTMATANNSTAVSVNTTKTPTYPKPANVINQPAPLSPDRNDARPQITQVTAQRDFTQTHYMKDGRYVRVP